MKAYRALDSIVDKVYAGRAPGIQAYTSYGQPHGSSFALNPSVSWKVWTYDPKTSARQALFQAHAPGYSDFLSDEIEVSKNDFEIMLSLLPPLGLVEVIFILEWVDYVKNECLLAGVRSGPEEEGRPVYLA